MDFKKLKAFGKSLVTKLIEGAEILNQLNRTIESLI